MLAARTDRHDVRQVSDRARKRARRRQVCRRLDRDRRSRSSRSSRPCDARRCDRRERDRIDGRDLREHGLEATVVAGAVADSLFSFEPQHHSAPSASVAQV